MQTPDLITLFIPPLNDLDIRYMVTGAVAAVIYGEPRLTRDLDLVMVLRPADAGRLAGTFDIADFYVPPTEVIRQESARSRHGHFNLIHHDTALKADCYMAGQDPLHAWAMDRRVLHTIGDVPVWFAPIEYVIVRKLDWFCDSGAQRHLDDIRAMMRVSRADVDTDALLSWLDRLGLQDEWRTVREDHDE